MLHLKATLVRFKMENTEWHRPFLLIANQRMAHRPSMCEVTQGLAYRPDMLEGLIGKRQEVFNRTAMCKGMWSPLTGLACVKGFGVRSQAWCV